MQPVFVKYSEKCIAVFGDTKPIKDSLKELGGKFNMNLTHNGEKKPGWIFPTSCMEDLHQDAFAIEQHSRSRPHSNSCAQHTRGLHPL